MKNNFYLFIITICILLFNLISCNKENDKSIIDDNWKSNDNYTIKFTNGKFITNKDYIICIEKKSKTKDFIILNLTDIQLRDIDIQDNTEFFRIAENIIEILVKKVKPDLITVTGDQGYGTKSTIMHVGNFIDQYGIPWAPIFGNHDNQEMELNTEEQAYLYENSFNNCLFKSGPRNLASTYSGSIAWGNYIINIIERDDPSSTNNEFHVVKSLIFINSGDIYDYTKDPKFNNQKPINDRNYAMLTSNQIKWYKWAVKDVQHYGKNGKVKSALFLHIPIYAYNTAFAAAYKTDVDIFNYQNYTASVKNEDVFDTFVNKTFWNEGYEHSVGGIREMICSPPYDDHVFEAIKNFDDNENSNYISTDLVIAGHDHTNNFIIEYEGVTLAYGLKTGMASYANEDLIGGSVILVHDSGKSVMYHQFTNNIKVLTYPWRIYLIIGVVVFALIVIFAIVIKRIYTYRRYKSISSNC